MNTSTRTTVRTVWVAVRAIALFTALLGVIYPLGITGIGQLVFPAQANGSIIRNEGGDLAGSALIGQSFTDAAGKPLSQYFQSRPSAAGGGYDALASSGTNYGPENKTLTAAIKERKVQIAKFNDVPKDAIPADALTSSASGLDPHISPAYAAIQVKRVANAQKLPADKVRNLVAAHTQDLGLGYIGLPRVNVLQLNLALDQLED